MLRHSLLRRLKSDKIAVNNRIAKEVKSNPDAVLKPLTEPENPYKRLAKKKQFGLDRSFEDYHQINEYDEENRVAEREVMHFARFKPDFEEGMIAPHIIMDENRADFLVVGGGLAGNLLANRLFNAIEHASIKPVVENPWFNSRFSRKSSTEPPKIVVVEKDPDGVHDRAQYKTGIVRSQFTNEANIRLARQAASFLRDFDTELASLGELPVDIDFQPQGTLLLGRKEDAAYMLEAHYTQDKMGHPTRLYRGKKMKKQFPWLNTDDIEMAAYSLEDEGTFDVRKLVMALEAKNQQLGIKYVKGEVNSFEPREFMNDPDVWKTSRQADHHVVKRYATMVTPMGKKPIMHRLNECTVNVADYPLPVPITFFNCLIATGSSAGETASLRGLRLEDDHLDSLVRIEKVEKRHYLVNAPDMPVLDMPILVDPDGLVIRRIDFNGHYEVSARHHQTEGDFWEEVRAKVEHRIPCFANHTLEAKWSTYSDVNLFDHNPIIGTHPYFQTVHFFCGFGGHDLAQMIGAADLYAMLKFNQHFQAQGCYNVAHQYGFEFNTAEFAHQLDCFGMDRLIMKYPLREHYTW